MKERATSSISNGWHGLSIVRRYREVIVRINQNISAPITQTSLFKATEELPFNNVGIDGKNLLFPGNHDSMLF